MEKYTIPWRGIKIEVTCTPEQFGMVDHIKLRTENKAPLPVTETGYRSHFMNKGAVAHHDGAVAFVTAWLDHEAERKGWSNDQLSLFEKRKFAAGRMASSDLYHPDNIESHSVISIVIRQSAKIHDIILR